MSMVLFRLWMYLIEMSYWKSEEAILSVPHKQVLALFMDHRGALEAGTSECKRRVYL